LLLFTQHTVAHRDLTHSSRPLLALTLTLALAACHERSAPPASVSVVEQDASAPVAPASPTPVTHKDPMTRLQGRVEKIRFLNINKARDRYTYLVELTIRHEPLSKDDVPAWLDVTKIPAALTVRTTKVYWHKLTPEQQQALAPAGPTYELTPTRWAEFTVGQAVELTVEFTSATLAHQRGK
jgi:hypothetical protein